MSFFSNAAFTAVSVVAAVTFTAAETVSESAEALSTVTDAPMGRTLSM